MNYEKETLAVEPSFDMVALMELMQETRLGGDIMDELGTAWDMWVDKLHTVKLKIGKMQYLLIWLDESVEDEIDEKWSSSPSDSFRFNCLAQCLIMSTVQAILPDVIDAGCAPAPKPTDALIEALEAEGLPYLEGETALSRRFATLTYFPFRGACEICYLQPNCPKAQSNAASFHSVEIQGKE